MPVTSKGSEAGLRIARGYDAGTGEVLAGRTVRRDDEA